MKHTPRRRAAAAPQTTGFLAFLRPLTVTSADASSSERCRAGLARMARAIAKKEAAAGGGKGGSSSTTRPNELALLFDKHTCPRVVITRVHVICLHSLLQEPSNTHSSSLMALSIFLRLKVSGGS